MRWSANLVLVLAMVAPLPLAAQTTDSDADGVPDATDAAPCDPNVAAIVYAPAERRSGSMLFEDQWPSKGDLDFNDVVVAYNYALRQDASGRVVSLTATYDALALGGVFDNGFGLHLPVLAAEVASATLRVGSGPATSLTPSTSDAEATFFVFDDLRQLFGGRAGQINSQPSEGRVSGQRFEVEVTFSTPLLLPISAAPFDVFVFRTGDVSLEIHRPEFAGTARMNPARFGTRDDGSSASRHFVDTDGLPFASSFPATVPYPQEAVSISTLYPDIVAFAASGGTQSANFFANNVNVGAAYVDVAGNGPLVPAPPRLRVPDTSCINAAPPLSVDAGPDRVVDEGTPVTGTGSFSDALGTSWTAHVDYGAGTGTVALPLAADKTFSLATVYPDDGSYRITVQVVAADGRVGSDQVDVSVRNVAPTVDVGPDASILQGQSILQVGTVADPGADAVTATVDFGDGSPLGVLPIAADGSFTLNHTYPAAGTFTLTVVATDDDGGTSQDTLTVTVAATTPVVDLGADASVDEGSRFSRGGGYTSPGSGPFVATVDYGDGAGPRGLTIGPGNALPLSHTYPDDGTFSVTVSVTDAAGNTGTDVMQVTVRNVAPTIRSGGDALVPYTATFSRTATVADPGADTFSGTVDWGDASAPQALLFNGGRFGLQHTYANPGQYTVTLQVSDDDGASSTASFQVTQEGPVPTAGCAATGVSSITHVAVDGTPNRDPPTQFPPGNMLDGDLTTRARYRTGGALSYYVDIALTAPATVGSVRTFVPVGIQTGYAGIRVWTDSGAGLVERYVDTRLFGIAGRFASAVALGGTAFAAGQVGLQGEVDHVFASGPVTGVTAIRLEVGYIDEITPEAPGGGDAVYSIYELSFCGPLASTQPLPQVVVDAGPDLTIPEASSVAIAVQAGLLTASSASAQVLWGDGTAPQTYTVPANGSFGLTHGYPAEGQYNLLVNVIDANGTLGSDQVQVSVVNVAPTVTLTGPASGTTGSAVAVSGQIVDPGNDPVSATIDWGDGRTEPLSIAGGAYTASHVYVSANAYSISVLATDDAGATATASVTVPVGLSCPAGAADCDGNPANGCESLGTIVDCGGCGVACSGGPNGSPVCVSGTCGLACSPGFSDCDGNPSNGCEGDLSSNAHCGGCGVACSGIAQCVNGTCQSHCTDGVLSGNETGVDCGGSCPACPTCSDGLQNQGEAGIDCGGPCPATCVFEVCNGLDDDGNGLIDDNPIGTGATCSVGVGACASTGAEICTGGALVCSGTLGAPTREVCGDGVDNDCDGLTDERCADTDGPAIVAAWSPTTVGVGVASTLTVSAADPSGPVSLTVTLDGAAFPLTGGAGSTTPLAPGVYTAVIIATDGLGNSATETRYLLALDPSDVTPPSAGLTGPAGGQEYTTNAPVVGTAADTNFFRYRLQYAAAGSTQFHTYHSSTTPVTNGTLGVLPTDLVPPGTYTVRVLVEDVNGATSSSSLVVALDGKRKPGRVAFCLDDGTMEVAGMEIAVDRCYDNAIKDPRDFGVGWFLSTTQGSATHSVPLHLGWQVNQVCVRRAFGLCVEQGCEIVETQAHRTVVHLGSGEFLRFRPQFNFGGLIAGACTGTMTFVPDTGNPAGWSLPVSLDVLGQLNGAPLTDSGLSTLRMDTFSVTGPNAEQVGLSTVAGITRYQNQFGEVLNFSPIGITHSGGLGAGFARDGLNRITSLAMPATGAVTYRYDVAGDLTEVRDGLARPTYYAYDAQHNLTSVTSPDGEVQLFTYDAQGRLASFEPLSRASTDVTRSANGLSETYAAPGQPGVTFGYDTLGNITSMDDGQGNLTTFGYDSNGNNTAITNPGGETTTMGYTGTVLDRVTLHDGTVAMQAQIDAAGEYTQIRHRGFTMNIANAPNARSITDASGSLAWSEAYDSRGEVTRFTTGVGNIDLGRDARGRVTSERDEYGNTQTFGYDDAGRLTAASSFDGTWTMQRDAVGQLTRLVDTVRGTSDFAYDGARRLTTADIRGELVSYEYDAEGRQTLTRLGDGRFEERLYNWRGRVAQYRGFDGTVLQMAYDAAGRQTSTDFGDGTFETMAYDAAGRVTRQTSRLGQVTTTGYDAAGRVTSTTDAFGTATIGYDPNGHPAAITSPAGRTFSMTRSATASAFSMRTGGQVVTAQLDAAGIIRSLSDGVGNTLTFTPDHPSSAVTVARGVSSATFRFRPGGVLREVEDRRGGRMTFQFDGAGRTTSVVMPDASTESYAYDPQSHLTRWVRGDGAIVDYGFDAGGNLTSVAHDGVIELASHDLDGRKTGFMRGADATTYERDLAGRITRAVAPWGGRVEYGYDVAGNRTLLRTKQTPTDPGRTTTYGYDARGLVTRMTTAAGTSTYQYDADGLPTRTTHPNGTQVERGYDSASNLTSVTHRAPGGAITASYGQSFDAAGHLTRVVHSSGRSVDYVYDTTGRIALETRTPATGPVRTIGYGYDADNNLTSVADSLSGTTSYVYDTMDRLVSDSAGHAYGYDGRGNLTSQTGPSGNRLYEYDSLDRMTAANVGSGRWQYVYDDEGRRIASIAPNGTRSDYLIDVTEPLYEVLEEGTGGVVTRSWTYKDGVEQTTVAGQAFFHMPDWHQSTGALTDTTGAVTDTWQYSAYGRVLTRTGSTQAPHQYVGQWRDPSGLDYMRARFYSSEHGRFLSRDPALPDQMNPVTVNRYTYAVANPVVYADPTGRLFSFSLPVSFGPLMNVVGYGVTALTVHGLVRALARTYNSAFDANLLRFGKLDQYGGGWLGVGSFLLDIVPGAIFGLAKLSQVGGQLTKILKGLDGIAKATYTSPAVQKMFVQLGHYGFESAEFAASVSAAGFRLVRGAAADARIAQIAATEYKGVKGARAIVWGDEIIVSNTIANSASQQILHGAQKAEIAGIIHELKHCDQYIQAAKALYNVGDGAVDAKKLIEASKYLHGLETEVRASLSGFKKIWELITAEASAFRAQNFGAGLSLF